MPRCSFRPGVLDNQGGIKYHTFNIERVEIMRLVKMIILGICLAGIAQAQFKGQRPESHTNVGEAVIRPSEGLLFGWLDLSRLSMRHSYSLSYSSFGGQGLSVGMYTNSLFYKFSAPLDVRFDVSLMHSPFGSYSNSGNFSGIFLNRAELNYRPTDNMWFQIQFRQLPAMYWGSGLSSGLYDGFRSDFLEEDR